MKLEKFKEKNNKKIGIVLFTISCVLLISGVILYRTFAIFEVNDNFNVINGTIEDEGNIRFMVYVDNELQKSVPDKDSGYSLDTSESYCENGSIVSWNDEKWSVEIKGVSTTKTKCYLYFKEIYKEVILNGAIPDLGNGRLIPITISDSELPSDVTSYTNNDGKYGGKVKKANITDKDNPWYSYTEHRWANAIVLKDGVADNYKPGDEIPENNIESYFVWIPRYRYQLKENESTYDSYIGINQNFGEKLNNNDIPNKASNNPYKIVFETKDKGLSTGTQKDNYLTHPAFVSFDSNGMWVGKFETGTTITDNNYNVINSSAIQIKPNVNSWRNIQLGNAFYTGYNYIRNLESHMIKNMEWGAIFYLTQSEYGRCINGNCTEPRINNDDQFVTGYSANFDPTCGLTFTNEICNKYESVELNKDGSVGYSYYNPSGQAASTTGNYYGIYDMAGGAWEYVMGVMWSSSTNANPASGRSSTYNSSFKGIYSCGTLCEGTETELTTGLEWPLSIYYDLYQYDTVNTHYQRGHLGDATKELGPFYFITYKYGDKPSLRYPSSYFASLSSFVNSGVPWFIRGGTFNFGIDASIGAFTGANGDVNDSYSFRIVLLP